LIICPDAYLAELPWDAISIADGEFLIESIDVAYAQDPVSLRDMLMSEPPKRDSIALLAVGDVDYGAREAWRGEQPVRADETRSAHDESSFSLHAGGSPPRTENALSSRGERSFSRRFAPLPDTRLEANSVAILVRSLHRSRDGGSESSDETVTLLTRLDATEEAFKSSAPTKHLLHLATHGFYQREGLSSLWAAAMKVPKSQSTEPLGVGVQLGDRESLNRLNIPVIPADAVAPALLTGLALAGVNAPSVEGRDDGVLTADEVARLDLSACDLAVLSACETALGQANPGEGLMSLRRAFLQAGAKTVISTLWRVDDRATRELMGEFYRRLLVEKEPPGAALRGAKLHLMKNTEFKEPRYWAAFTLAGDWR
jgi:CHAT domain-containing protein